MAACWQTVDLASRLSKKGQKESCPLCTFHTKHKDINLFFLIKISLHKMQLNVFHMTNHWGTELIRRACWRSYICVTAARASLTAKWTSSYSAFFCVSVFFICPPWMISFTVCETTKGNNSVLNKSALSSEWWVLLFCWNDFSSRL